MKIQEAVGLFMNHLRAQGCSPHTVRSYGCDLRALARFLGENRKVRGITANDLSLFLTSDDARIGVSGKLKSAGAINRLRAVLRSFFGWLYKTGQIIANPSCCLRVNAYKPPAPRLISQSEYEQLLQTIESSHDLHAKRDKVMFTMLAGTGIRLSELAGLGIEDIDISQQRLRVRTKAGGRQERYLSRNLCLLLQQYLSGRTSGALFSNGGGRKLTNRHIARCLKTWLERAGIDAPITPHTFRHTLATRLLERTGNLQLVQKALGHRSIQSTLRYTQVADSTLCEALEAV